MKKCQLCQRSLSSKLDWRIAITLGNNSYFCNNCLNDSELINKCHQEYITLNYYHHRHFLSTVLKQRFSCKNSILLTVGYQRQTINLYDETYAICELITKNCYSLTPTILPNKKLLTNIQALKYKKPLYVVSYNGLPKYIEHQLKNIIYHQIDLI